MGVKSGLFGGLGGFGGGVVRYGALVGIETRGEKNLTSLGKRLDKLNKGFLKFGVSTIFLDRLVQSFTRAFDTLNNVLGLTRVTQAAEQFSRLSRFTGVSTKNLQAFTAAASKVGVEADDVSDLFQTLTERVDDLRSGTEKGISDDFKRFGMDKDTFSGANDGMKQFLVLMKSLDKLAPEKRMAALEKLLGGDLARKFGQLGNVKDITRAMQDAIAKGVVLTDQQIAQAQRLAAINRDIAFSFEGISNGLFFILEPALAAVGIRIEEVTGKLGKFLRAVGPDVAKATQEGVDPLIARFDDLVLTIENSLMPIEEFLSRFALGLGVVAIGAVAVKLALGGILLIATGVSAVIAALAVVAEDLFFFFQSGGKTGLLARIVKDSPAIQGFLRHASYGVHLLQESFKQLSYAVHELFTGPIGDLMVGSLVIVVGVISHLIRLFGHFAFLLSSVVRVVVRVFSFLFDLAVTIGRVFSTFLRIRTPTTDKFINSNLGNMFAALYGSRDTNTERFVFGAAQGARNVTINQTNNNNVSSSNPSAAAGNLQGAQSRGVSNMAGGNP